MDEVNHKSAQKGALRHSLPSPEVVPVAGHASYNDPLGAQVQARGMDGSMYSAEHRSEGKKQHQSLKRTSSRS